MLTLKAGHGRCFSGPVDARNLMVNAAAGVAPSKIDMIVYSNPFYAGSALPTSGSLYLFKLRGINVEILCEDDTSNFSAEKDYWEVARNTLCAEMLYLFIMYDGNKNGLFLSMTLILHLVPPWSLLGYTYGSYHQLSLLSPKMTVILTNVHYFILLK